MLAVLSKERLRVWGWCVRGGAVGAHEKEEQREQTSLRVAGAMLSDAALPSGLLPRLALFLVMAKISDVLSVIDKQIQICVPLALGRFIPCSYLEAHPWRPSFSARVLSSFTRQCWGCSLPKGGSEPPGLWDTVPVSNTSTQPDLGESQARAGRFQRQNNAPAALHWEPPRSGWSSACA